MAKQVKGFCKYCGKEYTRGGIIRHLAACKERKAALDAETGKRKCGYFELSITDRYDNSYWLIIEMRETATLKDLDEFIRDIWVECCGHLSSFNIGGMLYDAVPDDGNFWGPPSKSMNYKLKDLFSPGMVMEYEYDFGSTTYLMIKVHDYRTGIWKSEPVTILSRNNPPEILCCCCKKNLAEWIIPEKFYEGDALWCKQCLIEQDKKDAEEELEEGEELEDDEEYFSEEFFLPVCNSPRMGVCAYEGSRRYPDQFEPDKK